MKTLLIVLAIFPWSLIGLAYLVYRRVRSQYVQPAVNTCTRTSPHEYRVNGPCNGFPKQPAIDWYDEAKGDMKTADADYIAKIGRA